jgi:hypothetical protein
MMIHALTMATVVSTLFSLFSILGHQGITMTQRHAYLSDQRLGRATARTFPEHHRDAARGDDAALSCKKQKGGPVSTAPLASHGSPLQLTIDPFVPYAAWRYLMVVRSEAVLFEVFTSPPPDTVTTLVTEDGAAVATFTLRVIAG